MEECDHRAVSCGIGIGVYLAKQVVIQASPRPARCQPPQANCAYYAIYQMAYLVGGVGGEAAAAGLFNDFRDYAESKVGR